MPFPGAYLVIAGGVCACAPLFKRLSNSLGRLLSFVGLFLGVAIIPLAVYMALGLSFLSSLFTIPSRDQLPQYSLPVIIVLGILLFSRPIRNVRWASLISLGIGLLAAHYIGLLLSVSSTVILGVVFLVATLAIYTLLRFVEDIFEFVGTVLAFPPVAVAIGLAAIYFGIVIAAPSP